MDTVIGALACATRAGSRGRCRLPSGYGSYRSGYRCPVTVNPEQNTVPFIRFAETVRSSAGSANRSGPAVARPVLWAFLSGSGPSESGRKDDAGPDVNFMGTRCGKGKFRCPVCLPLAVCLAGFPCIVKRLHLAVMATVHPVFDGRVFLFRRHLSSVRATGFTPTIADASGERLPEKACLVPVAARKKNGSFREILGGGLSPCNPLAV